jgi:hypothetical protein
MSTTKRKGQEKQAPSPDVAVMEGLAQLERNVDALCR